MQTTTLAETPSSMRLSIGFFGRTNSGKSSLINAIAGQEVSLVSAVSGTTTDPVAKPIEIYPLGPCVLYDTAGFGDESELGAVRMKRTMTVLDKTNLAVLVLSPQYDDFAAELSLKEEFSKRKIPFVAVLNQVDLLENPTERIEKAKEMLKTEIVPVSAVNGQGLSQLREAMVRLAPADYENESIIGHLVKKNDRVLLVMPQDQQAPKGRLILPQVQVLRDLLDHGAVTTCVTVEQLPEALSDHTPDVIITDSQVFPIVYEQKPKESALTSFSVLLARYKGDIEAYVSGAAKIRTLKAGDKVLIAEACSHQPLDGDIGRVKIPNLLHKKISQDIEVTVVSGQDFPQDLTPYALVIHCGGCMFGRRQVMSRVMRAVEQKVPITNYGIFLAEMAGILDKVEL
ncbi:MAG: [FeFe] hydrogenase H-cluster maturation GTPase HydF [Ruminococcaceae bacterium]|nr:[FeFe] hydrogenase H-cluster maturation GTPase HydF [Oscillospiraceae bacterium]